MFSSRLYFSMAKVPTSLSLFELPRDKTNNVAVRPAKTQISLGIRPVWSESSLCAQWVAKGPSFLHADSEDSDQTGLMPRLIWVFAGRTLTLLVLSQGGSFLLDIFHSCFFSKFWWFLVSKTTFKGFLQNFIAKTCVPWAHGASLKMVGPPKIWKFLTTEPNFQHVIKWDTNENQDRLHVRTCMMFM